MYKKATTVSSLCVLVSKSLFEAGNNTKLVLNWWYLESWKVWFLS